MTIIKMLTLDDVRPEARRSVEAWALKADPKRKKSFYRFFESGPEGASRGSVATSHGGEQMTTMEDAEKELEMRNWASSYQTTNNSLGNVLEQMRKRQQSGSERILRPLVREVLKPHIEKDLHHIEANFSPAELDEFVRLMRSLSIAFEQDRSAYNSEYSKKYIPKVVDCVPAPPVDFRASTLSAPITFAPPKARITRAPEKPKSKERPEMAKPAPRPPSQKGLLSWAGQEKHQANSAYRTFFQKPPENYPVVKMSQQVISNACGRTIPDHLITDEMRDQPVFLPWELETRHRLKQSKLSAQPSWHLLYKEGVTFDATGGVPKDKGDKSLYMRDFGAETSVMTQSKPTLDPFGSSITIGMSDYPYLTTTYQATLGRSATMEYDRRLV